MKYTYYISFNNSDWTQIYLMSSNKVTWEREPEEIFMRPNIDEIKIDGKRNATVFATIKTYFTDTTKFDDYIYFKIKKSAVDTFYFIASINDGKLDFQNNVYYVTPRPNDDYEKVMMCYDNKYRPTTAALFDASNSPVRSSELFTKVGLGWTFTDVSHTITWSNSSGDLKTATLPIDLGGGATKYVVLFIKNISITGEGPYFSVPGVGPTNLVTPVADGKYSLITNGNTPINITFSQDGLAGAGSGSLDYVIYYPYVYSLGNLQMSSPIEDVINLLLGATYMNTGFTAISTILWNDALPSVKPPDIDTYITANPTNDYVIEDAAVFNYLHIGKAESMIGENTEDLEFSFKDLMRLLKVLKLYWYIDSDGAFRIEHIKYFDNFASQIDLTTGYDSFMPEVDKLIYLYEKSDIYGQIVYSSTEQSSEEWLDNKITYSSVSTTPKVLGVTLPALTDVEYVMDNIDEVNLSGWSLFKTITGVTLPAVDVSITTDGNYAVNYELSWEWLINNYLKYDGEADTANAGALSLESVKKFKKQPGVRFYSNTLPVWYRPFTVTAGTGWIEKMELDLESGFYTVDFEFDPY